MGGIPLPALAVNPPQQQEDPVSKLMRLRAGFQQIQSGQLELQQRQQALADQRAQTQAFLSWDGKDPFDLAKGVLKSGGSASAATAVQQHFLQVRDTASQIAQRDSQTGETNLKTIIEKHNQFLGAINAAEQVPDEQLHDHLANTINTLIPDNADPQAQQFKQQTMQLLQSGIAPAQLRQQMDVTKKSLQGSKEQFAQAQTEAETRKTSTEALLNQSKLDIQKAWKSDPESVLAQVDQIVPATGPNSALNMRTKSQLMFALRRGDVDGAKDALKQAAEQVGAIEKETNPQVQAAKVAVATAEGQARANIETATARGSNAALAQVPPHLVAPASAAATKAGEDYAQAQSVSQRLQAMMDAAKQGNVVSYQLIPEEGALQVTTSQGVHRINMAEIQNYGGGSLWQRLQGHIGKQLTGESIPASVLSDMADMQKIQAEGSQKKYENTLKTVNQTYGSNFQPVQMAPMDRNTPAAQAAKSGPSPGATHTGIGSLDKKKHYLDANGKDLGVAE